MVDHPPFNLGNGRFVRFIPHDEGINYRATHGFRCGWIMILAISLDCRRTEYISDAINTIDRFHNCYQNDPRLVHTLVYREYEPVRIPEQPRFLGLRQSMCCLLILRMFFRLMRSSCRLRVTLTRFQGRCILITTTGLCQSFLRLGGMTFPHLQITTTSKIMWRLKTSYKLCRSPPRNPWSFRF